LVKYTEIHELSPEELDEKELGLRKELFNLKFRKATGQLDNTARIRLLKRDLARVLTSRRARQAAAPAASEAEEK